MCGGDAGSKGGKRIEFDTRETRADYCHSRSVKFSALGTLYKEGPSDNRGSQYPKCDMCALAFVCTAEPFLGLDTKEVEGGTQTRNVL